MSWQDDDVVVGKALTSLKQLSSGDPVHMLEPFPFRATAFLVVSLGQQRALMLLQAPCQKMGDSVTAVSICGCLNCPKFQISRGGETGGEKCAGKAPYCLCPGFIPGGVVLSELPVPARRERGPVKRIVCPKVPWRKLLVPGPMSFLSPPKGQESKLQAQEPCLLGLHSPGG